MNAAADLNELRHLETAAASAPGEPAAAAAPGDAQNAPPQVNSGEMLATMLHPTFSVIAPNWKITKQECTLLGDAYAKALDHYFPSWTQNFGPMAGAVLCTAAVFGPRLAMRVPPRVKPKDEDPLASRADAADPHVVLDPASPEKTGTAETTVQ